MGRGLRWLAGRGLAGSGAAGGWALGGLVALALGAVWQLGFGGIGPLSWGGVLWLVGGVWALAVAGRFLGEPARTTAILPRTSMPAAKSE